MRKVALSSDSFFPLEGGAERQLRRVLARFPTDEWSVVVVARRLAGSPDDELVDGLRVRRVGPAGGGRTGALRYAVAAARALAAERPDAIVALQSGSSAVAGAIARLVRRDRPLLVVRLTGAGPQGTDLESQGRTVARRLVGELVLRSATHVVAPAQYLLDRSGAFAGVVAPRAHLLPNGADAPAAAAPDGPAVVWMGRDHGPKGLRDFEELARRAPDLGFVVVGPDPARVADLANLTAMGWLVDPSGVLAAGRVLVSTSRHEGSPNVALEALAAGKPVVAYDIPAFRELQRTAGAGVTLVPLGDVAALEKAVRDVLAAAPPVRALVPSLDDAAARWMQLLRAGDPVGPTTSTRVLMVVGSLQIGGSETQAARLAIELARRGHPVKVLAVQGGGPLGAVLTEAGVEVEVLPVVRDAAGRRTTVVVPVARLWRSLRGWQPDVVHAWAPWPILLTMPLARVLRVPVRVAGRRARWDALNFRLPPLAWAHRLALRSADVVTANSEVVASDAIDLGRVPAGRVRVIGNGLELPDRVVDVGRQPAEGMVVARLRAEKGHVDLVRALALLDDPPVIHVVGDGPERGAVEAAIAAHGLADRVRLEGADERGGARFAEVEFAVLPSHSEGLPNVVLEAFSHGVPVVATAVGGVPELVVDEVTGLLVPPGEIGLLAAAIARMAADPVLRARLGTAARSRAEDFSWARCADEHEQLYRSVAAGAGRRPRRSRR